MDRKIRDYWPVYVITIIIFVISLSPRVARAADWTIDDWQVNVNVTRNGICRFEEARSYQFTGQVASIAAQWPVSVGSTIHDFTVTDQAGAVIIHEASPVSDSGRKILYNLPVQTAPGRQSWLIAYNVTGCISYFDNYDQLNWPITLDNQAEPIDHLRVRVILPRSAELLDRFSRSLTIETATGHSDLDGGRLIDTKTIEFIGAILPARSNVSFLASWPKGAIDDPGTLKVMARGINGETLAARLSVGDSDTGLLTPQVFRISIPTLDREVISLTVRRFGYKTEQRELVLVRGKSDIFSFELIPLWWFQPVRFGLAGAVLLLWIWPWWAWYRWYRRWRRNGRDPQTTQPIDPTLGPGQLTPSELGVIVDERVDQRDLTAGILFLAVQRYLTIERLERTWGHGRRDYQLIKLNKNTQILSTFEQGLLRWIFELGPITTLSSLADRRGSQAGNLTALLYDRVAAGGYFSESPAVVRRRYMRRPIDWLIISLALNLSALVCYPSLFIVLLPLLILAVMALLFASIMPKKTLKGAEVAHWAKRYVNQLLDGQKQSMPTMARWEFERALPYMLVLEADAMWLSVHSDSLTEWPDWLRPNRAEPYVASRFIRLYNQFIGATDTVFKSV